MKVAKGGLALSYYLTILLSCFSFQRQPAVICKFTPPSRRNTYFSTLSILENKAGVVGWKKKRGGDTRVAVSEVGEKQHLVCSDWEKK